ncbi:MAG: hypothetical protein HQK76_01520 [Desulfobacterales bacterium]|nr:hypothetical protein [Desulfobacterales bacterium]
MDKFEEIQKNYINEYEQEDEINILDILIVLFKRKKMIMCITLWFAMIAAIASGLMTPIYKAETTLIIPPSKTSDMMSGLSGEKASLLRLGGLTRDDSELYIAIIRNRLILDNIIDRFNLMTLYDTNYRGSVRNKLLNALKTSVDKKSEKLITISVEDKDRKRAADMTNAFVDELKSILKKVSITEASQRRLYFEEQLKNARIELAQAEEEMQGFQEKTGSIKIDDQARAVIEGIAELRAKVAGKEVELKVMKLFATEQNPDLQKVESELKGLRTELKKLESNENENDVFMSTEKMPEIGKNYMRTMRELKFKEASYQILLEQYELAKFDESKDFITIQVLDKATPPEKRIKPKRAQMVILSFIIGLFLSIMLAFFMEYFEKASTNPDLKEKLLLLKKL